MLSSSWSPGSNKSWKGIELSWRQFRNIQCDVGAAQHNTPKYLHKDHDHLRAPPLLSEFCESLVVLVPCEECLGQEPHSPCIPVGESPLPSTVRFLLKKNTSGIRTFAAASFFSSFFYCYVFFGFTKICGIFVILINSLIKSEAKFRIASAFFFSTFFYC